MLWQKWHRHHSTPGAPLNLWSKCFHSWFFSYWFSFAESWRTPWRGRDWGAAGRSRRGGGDHHLLRILWHQKSQLSRAQYFSHLPSHALHFIAHNIFTVNSDLQVNYTQFVNLILLTESVWLRQHPDHSVICKTSLTSQKFSRHGGNTWGTFSGSTLSDWLPFWYEKAAKEKCHLVQKGRQIDQSLRQFVSAIRSATVLSISLAVHSDQVFMLQIRRNLRIPIICCLERLPFKVMFYLFETTLVIKWLPSAHSGKSEKEQWICDIHFQAPSSWFAPRACPISWASSRPMFRFSFIESNRIFRVIGESLQQRVTLSFWLTVDRCLRCRHSRPHRQSSSFQWIERQGHSSACAHPNHCWWPEALNFGKHRCKSLPAYNLLNQRERLANFYEFSFCPNVPNPLAPGCHSVSTESPPLSWRWIYASRMSRRPSTSCGRSWRSLHWHLCLSSSWKGFGSSQKDMDLLWHKSQWSASGRVLEGPLLAFSAWNAHEPTHRPLISKSFPVHPCSWPVAVSSVSWSPYAAPWSLCSQNPSAQRPLHLPIGMSPLDSLLHVLRLCAMPFQAKQKHNLSVFAFRVGLQQSPGN